MSRKAVSTSDRDARLARRAGGARPLAPRLAVLAAAACLAACAPQVRNHGYVPSEAELAEIVVGIDDRASVEDSIGTPSAAGLLNETGYFYVAQSVSQYGWREPEVISREIVAISFDERGTVRNIERFGLEDGNVVALSRRVTDSSVEGAGFLRQLIGNVGRIDTTALGGG
jgi:outer membrane protein assembly factor BamE (lipoprotein component of BamABCDE complex)